MCDLLPKLNLSNDPKLVTQHVLYRMKRRRSSRRTSRGHLAVNEGVRPRRLIVMACSTRVTRMQVFERGDAVDFDLQPVRGGGGTSFVEPVARLAAEGIRPGFPAYLTDRGHFPDEAPSPYFGRRPYLLSGRRRRHSVRRSELSASGFVFVHSHELNPVAAAGFFCPDGSIRAIQGGSINYKVSASKRWLGSLSGQGAAGFCASRGPLAG
jgi:hypothetical protein